MNSAQISQATFTWNSGASLALPHLPIYRKGGLSIRGLDLSEKSPCPVTVHPLSSRKTTDVTLRKDDSFEKYDSGLSHASDNLKRLTPQAQALFFSRINLFRSLDSSTANAPEVNISNIDLPHNFVPYDIVISDKTANGVNFEFTYSIGSADGSITINNEDGSTTNHRLKPRTLELISDDKTELLEQIKSFGIRTLATLLPPDIRNTFVRLDLTKPADIAQFQPVLVA